MILFLIAYLGGVLTILSPCILPVLPFVFAKSDQSFSRSGLPLLLGMVITFAAVATLAAIGGGWAVQANQYGRAVAIVLLALFGVTLLFPALAERLTRPLVTLGSNLSNRASTAQKSSSAVSSSFLLGIATGLLWAPCAGPILGLLLTGAALQGASVQTSLLLLTYAAGAATSLGLALLIGGRVFKAMKKSLGVGEWIRRALGVAVLAGVACIALGLDTGLLASLSLTNTSRLEQSLLERGMHPKPHNIAANGTLPDEGPAPALTGAIQWLNSPPLTPEQLHGKVVLIDFWTYSCINCLRSLPYIQAWAEKYKTDGLVVIGVHAPEFAFEKDIANVTKAAHDLGITYPIAIDNDYAIWRAFDNHYWPAHYLIDANGRIRDHHFGEGDYDQTERAIQQLLKEAGKPVSSTLLNIKATGTQAAADMSDVNSPETYIGYSRAEGFFAPHGQIADVATTYDEPARLDLNHWTLAGNWTVHDEQAIANEPGARILYRFHARDLHLVLGPAADGSPIHFIVKIDGKAPGNAHGVDTDAAGNGTVTSQRLYQLIRQPTPVEDHTFEIQFQTPGVQAFAFTFG